MDIKLRKEFLANVEAAILSAEHKHHKVCDDFCTTLDKDSVKNMLLEVLEAYLKKDYKQCLKELAQVAAVAVRCMEFVYRLTPEAKASAKFKGGAND